MINSEYCSQDCVYLSLTEDRQRELKNLTGMTTHHFCNKYKVRLYHLLAHPNLYKCEQCFNNIVENLEVINNENME